MEYTIYKIVCNDLDIKYTYVGSTKQFTRRKCLHKYASNNQKLSHMKVYKIINENGGWDNWHIDIIETIMCDSKLNALIRERYWYEELYANAMNTIRPMCTIEEAKEKASETNKEYRLHNKETILSKQRKTYHDNNESMKEHKGQYRMDSKDTIHEYQKEYRINHKIAIKEQRQEYYENNKEKIAARDSEKIHCDACDCYNSRDHISRHNKSQRHQNNINKLQTIPRKNNITFHHQFT